MKKVMVLSALLFISALTASAQSCFHFSNGMSSYQSAHSDGTKVYVSVLIDGADVMTASAPCQIPGSATHTAVASITLTSGSGAKNTGTGTYPGCYSCYLNTAAGAQLAIGSDTTWDGEWWDEVVCSSSGGVYSDYDDIQLSLADTFGVFTYGSSPVCHYKANCTNTTTPKCGSKGWTVNIGSTETCSQYVFDEFLVVTINGVWSCYGIDFLYEEGGGECTPQ